MHHFGAPRCSAEVLKCHGDSWYVETHFDMSFFLFLEGQGRLTPLNLRICISLEVLQPTTGPQFLLRALPRAFVNAAPFPLSVPSILFTLKRTAVRCKPQYLCT